MLGICLVIAVLAMPRQGSASPAMAPSSFLHRLGRMELLKIMQEVPAVDSFWDRDNSGKDHKVLVFAPVDFAGFPAIAQARMTNDSLDRIDFYIVYHAHEGVKPALPYGRMGFIRASLDDFTSLRNVLTKTYREPSMMAETFFEYFAAPDRPYIVARYQAGTVEISITPAVPDAFLLKKPH